jgi:hypothetical protein
LTVETRFFRSDTHTVNGLTARKLGTAQSSNHISVIISSYEGNVQVTQFLGMRAWKRDVNGSETELTGGSAEAVASGSTSGLKSGVRSQVSVSMVETDSIVIRVYADDFSPPSTLKETLTTEQLGAQCLDAATWTVYYSLFRLYAGGMTTYSFRFGTAAYNSRVDDFTWSSGGAPCAVPQPLGDGLCWVQRDT